MQRALVTALLAALATPALATREGGASLTIYSGDYDAVVQSAGGFAPGHALVRERHRFELAAGANQVRVGGLPQAIDAAGVVFRALGDAQVGSQRFDFALAGQDELLRRAIGRTIRVEQAVGGERLRHAGVLLAAGAGLTLALPDGRVKVLSDYASFELDELPAGLSAEPALRWDVQAPRAGSQRFDLDYPTGGLAWRAEYLVTLASGRDCRLHLAAAAQIANRSGASFSGAQITLVAGQPNRVAAPPAPKAMRGEAMMMVADALPTPEASGEYHAWRLPGTTDLPDASLQRVPLMADARGVACERRYETRAGFGGWQPPTPIVEPGFGVSGRQPVLATLAFGNRKAAGLGQPLPAGRVRVFEHDGALLGEALLAHTPANAKVELELGTVFDLDAERRREDFRLDRAARSMTERISLTLRNAKPQAATVRVVESLPRWSEWEIVEASGKWDKRDAQSIAFEVAVPAGGETTVSYTVRYRWAPDVRIP
ncbi:MAG: DUF4139 domain-containing protein [Rehaibacterium terrae]|uniref:DUF4139 domain-containing protein n=1 Tax=Rehaibacterium terrae TaxID=1341696 RepID=UPI00391A79B5